MSDIETRVIAIVEEQLGHSPGTVKVTDRLNDDLIVDSLDKVELVMAIEEEFETEIRDEVAEKVATVQDLIDALKEAKIS